MNETLSAKRPWRNLLQDIAVLLLSLFAAFWLRDTHGGLSLAGKLFTGTAILSVLRLGIDVAAFWARRDGDKQ